MRGLILGCLVAGLRIVVAAESEVAVEGGEEDAKVAVVASVTEGDLEDFGENSAAVQSLLRRALELTEAELYYKYGSADPEEGGMDCSGTIYHLLRAEGFEDVPRTASGQYVWARKADEFEAVVSRDKDSFELDDLRPGDLLFWTGTYEVDRDPPVTHTMIYLGRAKKDDRMLMFGASEGRRYRGEAMEGVSVFDFAIPKAPAPNSGPGSRFVGYARIPGIKAAKELDQAK